MRNIVDYVKEEKHSYESRKFNAVDSLVLSQLAYLNFEGIVPGLGDAAKPVSIQDVVAVENSEKLFYGVNKSNRQLLLSFADSPRFCDTKLAFYVNQIDDKEEKQFSAVTYLLGEGSAYIAYRGTDFTVVGWKEDFNMAFISPVPSQSEGVDYLNAVVDRIACPLKIGGHSKGGNIAVYSSAGCRHSVQNSITDIYSHDGPGFRDEFFLSEGYLNIKGRIQKTIPQSSIIGMLLQHQENYSVVKSNRIGILQHDPFSWRIEDNDFLYIPSITRSANHMNKTLNQWINSFDDQRRELFVNTLFQIIQATDARTVYDLTDDWKKRAGAVLDEMGGLDNETRRFLFKAIRSLFALSVKNIWETKPED